jgi:2-polyprenyl-6-hydroxyphenyl methylase/3-demethylubiquinone-9 3-methyltransferase
MNGAGDNIDAAELARFEAAAKRWWDLDGEYAALHHINPLRVRFIGERVSGLKGKSVLDVGCGGGILSEALAARGAAVTGIDAGRTALSVAREHGRRAGVDIVYDRITVEDMAGRQPAAFDVVTCMELLEHVPSPKSVIFASARLLRPGGHLVIATLNRTIRSWLLAIVMAERVLGIVARGTHSWRRFVKPADIAAWGTAAGLQVAGATGVRYLPYINHAGLCRSMAVNYMMHLKLPPRRFL